MTAKTETRTSIGLKAANLSVWARITDGQGETRCVKAVVTILHYDYTCYMVHWVCEGFNGSFASSEYLDLDKARVQAIHKVQESYY